ncbi:ATPase, partial [Streptomyces sp. NPDC002596]
MTADAGSYVLGVDSGGSGLRVALGAIGAEKPVATAVCAEPVRTGPAGIDAGHLLEQLLPAVDELRAQAGERTRTAADSSVLAVA